MTNSFYCEALEIGIVPDILTLPSISVLVEYISKFHPRMDVWPLLICGCLHLFVICRVVQPDNLE